MPENITHCPLCSAVKSSQFDRREFRGQPVSNLICSTCGLVFQSPRMTGEELNAFYEQQYRELYQGQEGPGPDDLAVQRSRAESLLAFAAPQINSLANHLDIGCGAGLLLQKFRKHYECRSIGIEPGNAYRDYARSAGLKVYPSLDALRAERADQQTSTRRFDLISLAHVLEHLPEPVAYLQSLRADLLEDDGWLLVEVPNLYCHDSFEIAHLVSYSPHTLTQTLKLAGFSPISLIQHGEPRSHILPLYLTVLARPEEQISQTIPAPEKGVRRKRQLGLLHRKILVRLFPDRAWIPVRANQPGED